MDMNFLACVIDEYRHFHHGPRCQASLRPHTRDGEVPFIR